ncbi:MAG TPA: M56 family peptidase [Deltaproteobacteria bacterium]|nr:M56 family peptidase [Deltaproteobacteria bacterium]
MTVVLYVLPALALFVVSVTWLAVNVPHVVEFAVMLAGWCRDLLSLCLAYGAVAAGLAVWAGAALVGGGFLYAAFRASVRLWRGRRAIGRLPLVRGRGLSVALIRDDSLVAAFTCGIFRPVIYVSTGLLKGLTREEVRAVMLHEAHHRRKRDPLRSFVIAFFSDAFFYLPITGWLAGRHHHVNENAADDAAVAGTGSPLVLAGALVKVARSSLRGAGSLAAAPASMISGAGSVEGRIRRLVEGGGQEPPAPRLRVALSSLLIICALALTMAFPLWTPAARLGGCDMSLCTAHSGELAEQCRRHCGIETGGGRAYFFDFLRLQPVESGFAPLVRRGPA